MLWFVGAYDAACRGVGKITFVAFKKFVLAIAAKGLRNVLVVLI